MCPKIEFFRNIIEVLELSHYAEFKNDQACAF